MSLLRVQADCLVNGGVNSGVHELAVIACLLYMVAVYIVVTLALITVSWD